MFLSAGWENRTPNHSLENCYFTIKLIPQFGVPRVELGPYPPHGQILPLYYTPVLFLPAHGIFRGAENRTRTSCSQSKYTTTILRPAIPLIPTPFGVPGIEPGSHEPESCILPLYYTPGATRENRTPVSSLARTHSTTKPWSHSSMG